MLISRRYATSFPVETQGQAIYHITGPQVKEQTNLHKVNKLPQFKEFVVSGTVRTHCGCFASHHKSGSFCPTLMQLHSSRYPLTHLTGHIHLNSIGMYLLRISRSCRVRVAYYPHDYIVLDSITGLVIAKRLSNTQQISTQHQMLTT